MPNKNVATNRGTITSAVSHHVYLLPFLMWAMITIFYGYQYLLQVSPSVMAQAIMQDLHANATLLGSLAACYFYTYAVMQIPVGLILDRYGIKKPLVLAAVSCALGCILFAATHYFMITALGRLLIGFGGSFAVVGGLYIAGHHLPPRYFAMLTGATVTVGMIGAACGQAPLAFAVNALGWRFTMLVFGFIGLLIGIGMLFILRDFFKPRLSSSPSVADASQRSLASGLKQVIRNRQIWILAIYGGLMFMPTSVFGSLWGTPFLMQKYHVNNTVAGGIITMLFFGWAVGAPLLGWLSDFIKRRKLIMILSAFVALICMMGIIYPVLTLGQTSFLLFGYGFASGGFLVCYAAAHEVNTSHSTGVAMGFMNMINMIGGAIAQPLVGAFLDWRWNGVVENGIRIYSLSTFKTALTLLPLCLLIAILTTPLIKETYCKHQ